MTYIQVNLKRFDVSTAQGGIRPGADPVEWMAETMRKVVKATENSKGDAEYTFFPPEALLPTSVNTLRQQQAEKRVLIGSQGVHWDDVAQGGNFGAFTTSFPASAVLEYGATGALIGHSEERAKLNALGTAFLGTGREEAVGSERLTQTVNERVAASAQIALSKGLHVTFCVGETAEERGSEPVNFDRVKSVLRDQVSALGEIGNESRIILAYEPRWAIGPGKTPPGPDYIGQVSSYLKEVSQELFGRALPVLYGGGLKRENAAAIGAVPTVDGGLIALTKFTQPIGFDAAEMRVIVDQFVEGSKGATS